MLEMAHGHAPFAKFPPMKVLLMTLQNPPPTLDDKGKKHFSKVGFFLSLDLCAIFQHVALAIACMCACASLSSGSRS
jgi:hypothetical protein